jgi:hypothetical protein
MMHPVIWLKVTNQGAILNLGVFVIVKFILWLIVGEWFSQSVIVHFEALFGAYDQILFLVCWQVPSIFSWDFICDETMGVYVVTLSDLSIYSYVQMLWFLSGSCIATMSVFWMNTLYTVCTSPGIVKQTLLYCNYLKLIPPQSTGKENGWETEETLARAAVTLEMERAKWPNPWSW